MILFVEFATTNEWNLSASIGDLREIARSGSQIAMVVVVGELAGVFHLIQSVRTPRGGLSTVVAALCTPNTPILRDESPARIVDLREVAWRGSQIVMVVVVGVLAGVFHLIQSVRTSRVGLSTVLAALCTPNTPILRDDSPAVRLPS